MIQKFSLEEGVPSILLTQAPPPDLVGTHDAETGTVTLYSVSGGKHMTMTFDRCQRAFNGWAFVYDDSIEIPTDSQLVELALEGGGDATHD